MRTRQAHTRSKLLWLLGLCAVGLPSSTAWALEPFTDGTSVLNNPSLTSGVALGTTDMNGDGLDDIVRLHDRDNLEIEYQQADGSFTRLDYGDIPGNAWSLSLGDVDGNGYTDIFIAGAYDGLKVLLANSDGTDFSGTTLPPPSVFAQCSNFADMDNNGTLDLFVCDDDDLSAPFSNDGEGNFTYDLGLINAVSTVPSDNSGNYGSVWTDYDNDGDLDLFIAKCRLFVNPPLDGRRLNLLFRNEGNGEFTEVAEAAGLRPGLQSWAIDFGDIDNDGDLDSFMINHDFNGQDGPSQLSRNEGPGPDIGTFTNITSEAGLSASLNSMGDGIQVKLEDFDNDTFLDIFVTGSDGEHRFFLNNGDSTFTEMQDPFPTGGLGIQSGVVGDFNNDGFPDVLAGFANGFNNPSSNPDRVFINAGNSNGYFNIRLTGVESNRSAVGARVELYGAWGVQIREVRAGEGYGITHTLTRHFGLGDADSIDSVVVRWPSGQVDTIDDPPINLTVHLTEGCSGSFYRDVDDDGHGDAADAVVDCIAPDGYVDSSDDCDDGDPNNFPGNEEVCDEADNNCDSQVDEDLACGNQSSTGNAGATGDGSSGDGSASGQPPLTTGNGGGGTDGSTGSDPGQGGGDDGGGCGCDVSDSRGAGWFGLLAFGLFSVTRRRRTRRAAR